MKVKGALALFCATGHVEQYKTALSFCATVRRKSPRSREMHAHLGTTLASPALKSTGNRRRRNLRASVSKFISMLNYPRGAELPGNCRLPLLVLSSWILVLRRGWSYRLMFQLFHFAHLQLWLCFSNGTSVHTLPQYRQGVSTNAARGDVWAFLLGAKLFIHASIHFLHPLSPALRALLPQGQGQGFTLDLL